MASPAPIPQVLPLNLLSSSGRSKGNHKIWDGKISVTASTEGFWELDKEFHLKSRIDQLKRKFHENRYLKVKFLPINVSEKAKCSVWLFDQLFPAAFPREGAVVILEWCEEGATDVALPFAFLKMCHICDLLKEGTVFLNDPVVLAKFATKIQQMLSDFPVARIQCNRKSDSAGNANVYLEDPEMFEEWDKNRIFMLRGQRIPVSPAFSESWVCVARLPLHVTENDFSELMKSVGEIRNCFLMVSEKTGESKGYGLADYYTKDKAATACERLGCITLGEVPGFKNNNNNNNGVESDADAESHYNIWSEVLHSKCTSFESLQSKCLYISNLPCDYIDMANFRKTFSVVAQPPYCQIAMKNGLPLSWGLVEYNTGEEAESTLLKLNGTMLGDKPLRISYYVPGVRAIHLYGKLITMVGPLGPVAGSGLLPNPPAPLAFRDVKKLRRQNPIFAMNVENILVSEILGGKTASSENSSESDQVSPSKKVCKSIGSNSRTPSPFSDPSPTPNNLLATPASLPTPEDSAGENSPTESQMPIMPFPVTGNSFVSQASLHHMMVAAQNFGNDPNQVVPEVLPYSGGYPFTPHISMLPVSYIPLSAPGLYPMSLPVVSQQIDAVQAVPRLPTPENVAQIETILVRTAPVIPPGFEKMFASQKNDQSPEKTAPDMSYSPPGKKADEALGAQGISNIWGPKEKAIPLYNRLGPNGLLEKVTNLNGGVWASNISPPSLKRRANVWPIYTESEFVPANSQSKRKKN